MIKAVFFDFYNTLAYFWPPVQEIQASACREIGLFVEEEGILRGYAVADELFSRENHDRPLYLRSEEERNRFFSHYEQLILRGAGLDVSAALAESVWRVAATVPKSFALFADVASTLAKLKEMGLATGVLSNLNEDLVPIVTELGLAPYLTCWLPRKRWGRRNPRECSRPRSRRLEFYPGRACGGPIPLRRSRGEGCRHQRRAVGQGRLAYGNNRLSASGKPNGVGGPA